MKITSADFKRYTDWQKFILRAQPELPKDCQRPTLIAFCLTLAIHGSAGRGCYVSDTLLGEELGIGRKYLAKYRRLAKDLGWFVPSSEKVNRVESLNIAIPLESDEIRNLAKPAEDDDEPWVPEPKPKVSRKPTEDDDDLWTSNVQAAQRMAAKAKLLRDVTTYPPQVESW